MPRPGPSRSRPLSRSAKAARYSGANRASRESASSSTSSPSPGSMSASHAAAGCAGTTTPDGASAANAVLLPLPAVPSTRMWPSATGSQRATATPLLLRQIDKAEAGPGKLLGQHERWQGLEPGSARRRGARPAHRDRVDVGRARERELHRTRLGAGGGEDAPTTHVRGQLRRGIRSDHGDAVGPIVHAHADAQVCVGEHGIAHDAGRALRAEHEVHPERPAARGEIGEQRMQVGMLGDHRGELVDDDHEAGETLNALDVARAGRHERPLAIAQLGSKTLEGAARPIAIEVGEDAGDVRQPPERRERGAPLEVHEQQRELLRRLHGGHREQPGDEQLALAAAGGARDDRVRPVCDEVDEGGPGGIDRRCAGQSGRRAASCEHRPERHHGRQCAAVLGEAVAGGVGGELPHPAHGCDARERLRPHLAPLVAIGVPGDARPGAVRPQHDPASHGEPGLGFGHGDERGGCRIPADSERDRPAARRRWWANGVRELRHPAVVPAAPAAPVPGRRQGACETRDDTARDGGRDRERSDDPDPEPGVDDHGGVVQALRPIREPVEGLGDAARVLHRRTFELHSAARGPATERDGHWFGQRARPALRVRGGGRRELARRRRRLGQSVTLPIVPREDQVADAFGVGEEAREFLPGGATRAQACVDEARDRGHGTQRGEDERERRAGEQPDRQGGEHGCDGRDDWEPVRRRRVGRPRRRDAFDD